MCRQIVNRSGGKEKKKKGGSHSSDAKKPKDTAKQERENAEIYFIN